MVPEIQTQLSGLLVKIGNVAPAVWQTVLQQQINSAHLWLTINWIALIAGLVLLVLTLCVVFSDDDNAGGIFFACITFFFVSLNVWGIVENNLILKNPAYYAMQDLAHALKP